MTIPAENFTLLPFPICPQSVLHIKSFTAQKHDFKIILNKINPLKHVDNSNVTLVFATKVKFWIF